MLFQALFICFKAVDGKLPNCYEIHKKIKNCFDIEQGAIHGEKERVQFNN